MLSVFLRMRRILMRLNTQLMMKMMTTISTMSMETLCTSFWPLWVVMSASSIFIIFFCGYARISDFFSRLIISQGMLT